MNGRAKWQHAALLPFPYYTKLPLALLVDGGLGGLGGESVRFSNGRGPTVLNYNYSTQYKKQ